MQPTTQPTGTAFDRTTASTTTAASANPQRTVTPNAKAPATTGTGSASIAVPSKPEWMLEGEFFGAIAVKLLVLAVLGFALVRQLTRLLSAQEPPCFDNHWGGLGRGLGGWRINFTLMHLLLTLVLALAFVGFGVLAIAPPGNEAKGSPPSAAAAQISSDTAKPENNTVAKPGTE